MVNPWISPEDQDKWEAADPVSDQLAQGQLQNEHQPPLARIIRGTGKVLSSTRHKLASWYKDRGEQSYGPHIDI